MTTTPTTPAKRWIFETKPWTSSGLTVNIFFTHQGGQRVCQIPPSTSRSREDAEALAARICAVPVLEAALKQIADLEYFSPATKAVAIEAFNDVVRIAREAIGTVPA